MHSVELTVDGTAYLGWKRVEIRRSLREAAASFRLDLTDRWAVEQVGWTVMPGAAVLLSVDGITVLTGYADIVESQLAAEAHRLSVTGRSKTADLVDCAAVVSGGQFKGNTIAAIARALAGPFGIDVDCPAPGAPFKDVQVNQGESCFDLIERLARLRGLMVTDTPSGTLRIIDAAALAGPAHAVREGVNMLEGSVKLDWSRRFSEYVVKAQQPASDQTQGEAASAVRARVTDDRVTRFRPWMKVAEAGAGPEAARQRARWQAKTAAARALTAEAAVQGWYADDGVLWSAGQRCVMTAPTLGVDHQLMVETASLSLGEDGATVALTLVPEDALTPEPSRAKGKSATAASGPASEAVSGLEWAWSGLGGIEDE